MFFKIFVNQNSSKDVRILTFSHTLHASIYSKLAYSFTLETENYVLHLPEFVDHFYEWDRNKDSYIAMDEVKYHVI